MKILDSYLIRKRILIGQKLQFKYVGLILTSVIFTCTILVFTVYLCCLSALTANNTNEQTVAVVNGIIENINVMLLFELPILLVIACFVGVIVSHKIAGPVYRLEKVANEVARGDLTACVNLRKDDELKQLSNIFNSVVENLQRLVSKDKKLIFELSQMTDHLYANLKDKKISEDEALALIRKLNDLVGELKTLILQYKVEKG